MARRSSKPLSADALLNEAHEPVFMVSSDRKLIYLNQALLHLAGFAKEQLLGESLDYLSTGETSSPAALLAALAPPPDLPAPGETIVSAVYLPRVGMPPLATRITFWNLGNQPEANPVILGVVGRIPQPPVIKPGLAQTLHAELAAARLKWRHETTDASLVGHAPLFRKAIHQAELAAGNLAPLLIVGENGTGKEHFARSIHQRSSVQRNAFVPLDCQILTEAMLHEVIQHALESVPSTTGTATLGPGTILLKSIDAAPRSFWQQLEQFRKASIHRNDIPIRWMATSRLNSRQLLEREICDQQALVGISTIEIELPPLRERGRDALLIAQHLLEEQNRLAPRQLAGWSPEVQRLIGEYNWPGNIAELKRFVTESRERAQGPIIQVHDLPHFWQVGHDAQSVPPPRPVQIMPLDAALEAFEKEQIKQALAAVRGNRSKAADLLEIPRPRLYRRMEQLGLGESED